MRHEGPPERVLELPKSVVEWTHTLAAPDTDGLFKSCVDSEVEFDFPSSMVSLGFLSTFYKEATDLRDFADTAAFVHSCQEPNAGLFIDPNLDPRFTKPDDQKAKEAFRAAVTKYTLGLLGLLGAKPLYPYAETGAGGIPNPDAFLAYITKADWTHPWATGSHAAGQLREIFLYANTEHFVNEDQATYITAVEKGFEIILSHQNPETGMWGDSSIPLYEQISGTLKVIGRLLFHMGFTPQHMDRLADSCITHHAGGSFYTECDDMCIPRNVAEMCIACLESSDYRKEELLATLSSTADTIGTHRMPDGSYASDLSGLKPIQWCGASICGAASHPRGNVNGTQAAVWALGLIGDYLDWGLPISSPQAGWKKRVEELNWRMGRNARGRIFMEKV